MKRALMAAALVVACLGLIAPAANAAKPVTSCDVSIVDNGDGSVTASGTASGIKRQDAGTFLVVGGDGGQNAANFDGSQGGTFVVLFQGVPSGPGTVTADISVTNNRGEVVCSDSDSFTAPVA